MYIYFSPENLWIIILRKYIYSIILYQNWIKQWMKNKKWLLLFLSSSLSTRIRSYNEMYIYITPRSHTLWHAQKFIIYVCIVHISYFLQLDIYLQCAMTMMCPSFILTRYIALIISWDQYPIFSIPLLYIIFFAALIFQHMGCSREEQRESSTPITPYYTINYWSPSSIMLFVC